MSCGKLRRTNQPFAPRLLTGSRIAELTGACVEVLGNERFGAWVRVFLCHLCGRVVLRAAG